MASQERSMPFIKNMASSDRKTRTAALDSLRTFLASKAISTNLTTLDTLKLWKGLFYALWMCDRPLPQQQLCADLAALIWVLPQNDDDGDDDDVVVVPRWLRAFWATMAREWTTGIDVLRMEKFLLLVRRMLGASLVWMQVREEEKKKSSQKRAASGKRKTATGSGAVRYDAQRVEAVLALLAEWPFRPDEETRRHDGDADEEDEEEKEGEEDDLMPKTVPVGLKLHALDIWVDEAEKAGLLLAGDEDEKKEKKKGKEKDSLAGREVLQRINDLVDKLNKQTLSKAVRIRSKESLADDRLPWNEDKKDKAEEGDGEWAGLDD